MLGHGWLNFINKNALLDQYASLGFSNPGEVGRLVGIFEMAAACAVLIRPFRTFVLFLFGWKIVSELFYPKYELFEWIERGGSYCSLLALYFILHATSSMPFPLHIGFKHKKNDSLFVKQPTNYL
jgi:hypothetical protein